MAESSILDREERNIAIQNDQRKLEEMVVGVQDTVARTAGAKPALVVALVTQNGRDT